MQWLAVTSISLRGRYFLIVDIFQSFVIHTPLSLLRIFLFSDVDRHGWVVWVVLAFFTEMQSRSRQCGLNIAVKRRPPPPPTL